MVAARPFRLEKAEVEVTAVGELATYGTPLEHTTKQEADIFGGVCMVPTEFFTLSSH